MNWRKLFKVKKNKRPFYKSTYFPLSILGVGIIVMLLYVFLVPSAEKITYPSSLLSFTQRSVLPTQMPTPALSGQKLAVQKTPSITPTAVPTLPPSPTLNPGISWYTYSNAQYGYSILYPPNWTVTDLGQSEPDVPSYVVFNPNTATTSARSITISVSTRTYQEQLAIGNTQQETPITVSSITGMKQNFQDSDFNQLTSVILPRTSNLLVLDAQGPYNPIFTIMLSTLRFTF